jgi:tol-pal system protein YbgF
MKQAWNLIFVALLSTPALISSAWAVDTAELSRQVQTLQQSSDSLDARLAKMEAEIQNNQSMLVMLKEIETLKVEVAKLRGLTEVQAHQLDTLDKRQTDLYTDLDQRLGELAKAAKPAPEAASESPVAAVDASSPPDIQAETAAYEAALKLFRQDDYKGAIADFKTFLKTYPTSTLASNAQYWIGYSYYALKDYKTALAHQQKLLAVYPSSAKVPDSMLNIATNQIALNNLSGARKTLEQLIAKYPGTPAATQASRRLAALK